MKTIIEDCKRVEIENDGIRNSKTINIIRKCGTNIKIEIGNARLKGHWINTTKPDDDCWWLECSICGNEVNDNHRFCSYCGACMKPDEET